MGRPKVPTSQRPKVPTEPLPQDRTFLAQPEDFVSRSDPDKARCLRLLRADVVLRHANQGETLDADLLHRALASWEHGARHPDAIVRVIHPDGTSAIGVKQTRALELPSSLSS